MVNGTRTNRAQRYSRIINNYRVGRAIRNRLPVELHRRIDRIVNQSIPRIRHSQSHLTAIRTAARYGRHVANSRVATRRAENRYRQNRIVRRS